MNLVVDPGSCHLGKIDRAKLLITTMANAGASAIKFQLFKPHTSASDNNIPLPYEWWPELCAHAQVCGIGIYASIWDDEGLDLLVETGCKSVKFSYRERGNEPLIKRALNCGLQVFVSCDLLNTHLPPQVNKLWIHADGHGAQYPYYTRTNWSGLFPTHFHGASIHSLDIMEPVRAFRYGAKMVEVHGKIGNEPSTCLDSLFAFSPKQITDIVNESWRSMYV